MGQYVLESSDRVAEPHDRNIPREVEKNVYSRDNNTCRVCGWDNEKWSSDDPRILELHHLIEHKDRGEISEINLTVICSQCHDEVHSGRHKAIIEKIKNELASNS
jgi:5-methylcytosine-specific restriction endonuclease McrA